MQKDVQTLRNAGIEPVSISYDSAAQVKKFAANQNVKFPVLADPGSKTITAYDVFDKRRKKGTRLYGHSYPVTFLINRQGIIVDILKGTTRNRHAPAELIKASKKKVEANKADR